MEQQREWMLGAHVLRFEPPDLLWVDFRGEVSLEEIKYLVDLYRELASTRPFLLVGDFTGIPVFSTEMRRYLGEHADPSWILANVIIGARLAHRAAAQGVLLAAWLTGRADKSVMNKVHFVSTRAEASELVARLRAQHGDKVA